MGEARPAVVDRGEGRGRGGGALPNRQRAEENQAGVVQGVRAAGISISSPQQPGDDKTQNAEGAEQEIQAGPCLGRLWSSVPHVQEGIGQILLGSPQLGFFMSARHLPYSLSVAFLQT